MWKHVLAMVAALAVGAAASANIIGNSKPLIFDTDGDGVPDAASLDFARSDFDQNGDGFPDTTLTFIAPMGAGKPVIGFWFMGDYFDDGPGRFTWWASDLQMTITAPLGRQWTVGGYGDIALGPSDENWNGWNGSSPGPTFANGGFLPISRFPNDGQVPPPDLPGVFLSSVHFPDGPANDWKQFPQQKEGIWTVEFALDWFGGTQDSIRPMEWKNVSITLHNIPAPGPLALLGLAGVLFKRRRRR